ncbi:MAG: Asp-tRNA(Asn)/Glu-tRNA(Gln) amidotransferase subunit GatC [Verrucomicrobiota bacterium]|nr:Asp-tRNA(Asn)/Glu-tRNA(Gln) amidotransferase subunit GatC [Verrucomicrobiota bacterium]
MSDSKSGPPEIDVGYVASLARLELTDEETAQFQKQLGDILAFVDTLSSLEVEGVDPTAHPAPVIDCFREDEAGQSLAREQFLRNAPDTAMDQVRVPKVVDS